ncbi:MAG: class I SAM-dependent methyltransferase [Deltaproteobacteria bacterium]|nr:class I SAM-dependent methyltransferase [Deltaproteobacteria bacterium]
MHQKIFHAFNQICRAHAIRGRVLEIGATPDASTLLSLPALARATEKIGINKAGASRYGNFTILSGDANAMTCFPDRHFDAVLSNSVLEHDPFFWRSLTEMRRVARPRALIVIGAPGYGQGRHEKVIRRWLAILPRWLHPADGWALQHSTLTLGLHNYPGDYYRFSEQAFREVFLEGLERTTLRSILNPPRFIGSGIMP